MTSCSNHQSVDDLFENQLTESRVKCNVVSCLNPTIQTFTKDYTINNCVITATYTVEICEGLMVTISNMSYTFANSAACNNTKQVWNQHWLQGQTQIANEAINVFYNQITLLIEDDVLANLDPTNFHPLLQWVETYCHTLCVKEIKYEDLPSFFELSQVVCGKGCCIRLSALRVINGALVKVQSWVTGGECDPLPIKCSGSIPLSCSPACNRIK